MSVFDRVRQFREATRLPDHADYELARDLLPTPLYALFCQQHPRDIVHSALTARWLIDRGYTDSDMLAAALLHDIGKGQQERWHRVAYVLAQHTGTVEILAGDASSAGWRQAIARSLTHSEIGARLLSDAGAAPGIIELTLHHHDPSQGNVMLELLQEADAAS